IFKTKYIEHLKNNVLSGKSLEFYKSKEFVYDKEQILMMPNMEVIPNLIDSLAVNDDFKTAVKIYESYKKLEPIQASDERLWVYLAHVDLYPYMIKRWPEVYTGKSSNPSKYILDHWFLRSS